MHSILLNVLLLAATAALAFLSGFAAAHGVVVAAAICGAVAFLSLAARSVLAASSVVLGAALLVGNLEVPRVAELSLVSLGLALCAAFMVFSELLRREEPARPRFPLWSLLFVGVVLLSSSSVSGLSGLATPLLAGFLAFLIMKRSPASLLVVLGVVGLCHAALGITESLTHSSIIYTAWKDAISADVNGIRRAASTVGDPNYLAVTLLCAVPGVAYISRDWKLVNQGLLWLPYVIAFVLTFSRSGYLAVAVAVSFYLLRSRRGRWATGKVVGVIAGAVLVAALVFSTPIGDSLLARFSFADASTRSRSTLQSETLGLFLDHWATGLGVGSLPDFLAPVALSLVPVNEFGVRAFLPQTNPLNTYLLVGAEGGVLGLALLFSIMISAYIRSSRGDSLVFAAVVGVFVAGATLDLVQSLVVWCLIVVAVHSQKGMDPQLKTSSGSAASTYLGRSHRSRP